MDTNLQDPRGKIRCIQQAGKTVGTEEKFFIKAIGRGRYWK